MPSHRQHPLHPATQHLTGKTGKPYRNRQQAGSRKAACSRPAGQLILTLLMVLWLPALNADARVQVGDITVEQVLLFSTPDQQNPVGAIEYRYLIRNASTTRNHSVELLVPELVIDRWQRERALAQMTRRVEVAPGSSVEISLFQPSMSIRGGDIRVRVAGVGNRTWYGGGVFQRVERGWHHGSSSVSAAPGLHIFSLISADAGRFLGEEFIHPSFSQWPVREPAQWPTNWLSYSTFRVIAITTSEWQRTSAAGREALMHWVRAGGTLLLIGRSFPQLPETARLLNTADPIRQFEYGSGRWLELMTEATMSETDAVRVRREQLRHLIASSTSRAAASSPFTVVGPHAELERDRELPIRPLIFAVIIFALLLGPVNLFVLRRKKLMMWIFVTVPAISLLSAGMIGAYAFISEGISPRIRVSAVVTLDQRDQTAVTRGLFSYRTPLTPGGGLRFDDQTIIHPLGNLPQDVTIDWTGGQHLNSGWLTAGNVTHLAFTRSESQYRPGVQIQMRPDGTVRAVNQLGVTIDQLVYCDPDGRSWIAQSINAGAGVTLHSAAAHPDSQPLDVGRSYLMQLSVLSPADAESRSMLNVPGTWRAIVTDPTFLDHGLRSGKVQSRVLVFGVTEDLAP